MKYNFLFLEKLGPQWKNVIDALNNAQAKLEFDYKQAVYTSYRCVGLIVTILLKEAKLNPQESLEENLKQLKDTKHISEALYSKLEFILTTTYKAKYMEDEIVNKAETETCMKNVYDLLSWYAYTKEQKKIIREYDFSFLPERLGKVKINMIKAVKNLKSDPENTLIKCRMSMEIIIEDIAKQDKIELKSDRLYDNIEAIKEVLPQDVYFSMQSTRSLGNIGGHKNEATIRQLRRDARTCLDVTYRTLCWFSKDYKPREIVIKSAEKPKSQTPKKIKFATKSKEDNTPKKVLKKWGTSGEYSGFVLNGKRHGKGRMIYVNGDIYDGFWIEDKRHGLGKMVYVHGNSIYQGEWEGDIKNGEAKSYKYANGDEYQGSIKRGKRHGKGIIRYANGDIYEGMWKENKRHGEGILKCANGDIFEGEFNNDEYQNPGYTDDGFETIESKAVEPIDDEFIDLEPESGFIDPESEVGELIVTEPTITESEFNEFIATESTVYKSGVDELIDAEPLTIEPEVDEPKTTEEKDTKNNTNPLKSWLGQIFKNK